MGAAGQDMIIEVAYSGFEDWRTNNQNIIIKNISAVDGGGAVLVWYQGVYLPPTRNRGSIVEDKNYNSSLG